MNGFDIGASAVLLAAGVWSFFRGLTREVISLLGLIAAIGLGGWGTPLIAVPLNAFITPLWLRQAIGFIAIFLAVVLAYSLLARLVCRMVDAVGLSLPDCILGSLFGSLKAAVLIALLLIVLTRYDPDATSRLTASSRLAPPLFRMAQLITSLLPADLDIDVERFYHRLQRLHQGQRPPVVPAAKLRAQPPMAVTPRPAPVPETPSGISRQDDQSLRKIIRDLERRHEP